MKPRRHPPASKGTACGKFRHGLAAALILLLAHICQAQASSQADARELFRLANQARAHAGRKPLKWSDQLAKAALVHTQLMAKKGAISHGFPGERVLGVRLQDSGTHFDAYGENVAFANTAKAIHNGWMHSEGHRRNLLDPSYTYVGIAVVRVGSRLYATQDFADLVPETHRDTAAPVRQALLKRGLKEAQEIPAGQLKQAACSGKGPKLPKHHATALTVHYTTLHVTELPSELKQQLSRKKFQRFEAASCEVNDAKTHTTTEAFVVVLFE